MARPRVGDLIKQTTDTEGTGSFVLGPSVSGFWPFSDFADGTPIYYTVVDNPDAITECEMGVGRYVAGSPDTITRDRVIKSTNSDAKVDWTPGTKTIICAASAEFLNTIIESLDSDLVTTGTSTAYAIATLRPDVGLYEGRFLCVKLHTANGANPTLNVDGAGAKAIVDINGAAPATGALTASYFWLKYDATATKWVIFSPFNYLSATAANVTGTFALSGTISPTALSADQNDYNPTNLSTAAVIRQDLSANVEITGLAGGSAGRFLVLRNFSTSNKITLKDASASSTAANRFAFGRDVILQPKQDIVLLYDATAQRWTALATPDIPAASTSVAGQVQLVGSGVDTALADATKALTALALGTIFARSLAASGYMKLPGGFILQWGSVSVGANSTATVTLPTTFSDGGYQALVSYGQTTTTGMQSATWSNLTTNSIDVTNSYGSGTRTITYFALGK